MKGTPWLIAALLLGSTLPARNVHAGPLSVQVWTDRGHDGVYEPGDRLRIDVRPSQDAYLLVYEIDAEGSVHLLFPYQHERGFVEGRATYHLPPGGTDADLVVQGPVGQGYIVAIASFVPFQDLPWYLRPYNAQAEELGYEGRPDSKDDEEGVTAEGRIVGDPFVAMERIRRRVLDDPNDETSFATAYESYYVHHAVRYPRYLCYDCHRPHEWAWWDGFDPYYTTCSVFSFRVNWAWYWGHSFWCGFVPYYYYVYRPDCPPRYRAFYANGASYSSWDGRRRWRTVFGSALTRYKSDPPPGYRAPTKFDEPGVRRGRESRVPPGFLTGGDRVLRGGPRFEPVRRGEEPGVIDRGIRTRRDDGPPQDDGRRPARPVEPGVTMQRPWHRTGEPVRRDVREYPPMRGGERRERVDWRPRFGDRVPREVHAPRIMRPEPREQEPRRERAPSVSSPPRDTPPPRAPENRGEPRRWREPPASGSDDRHRGGPKGS